MKLHSETKVRTAVLHRLLKHKGKLQLKMDGIGKKKTTRNPRAGKCLKNGKSYSIHAKLIMLEQKHLKVKAEHFITLN